MIDILKFALLFGIGGIAGFTNVMAGGGSSLTLPALIFMGLEPSLANGTNRIAIVIQNISAVSSFRKNRIHRFELSFQFALYTLPGAIIGAFLAVQVSDVLFQRILGMVLILITISMFISHSRKNERKAQGYHQRKLIYLALFGIGFYGGFIQVGVGFLFMAALYHLLRLDLVFVNMHKVFIILIYTLPALLIFVISGNVNWKFGLILAAGNALGAWWGAHVAVRRGEKIIRIILAIAIAFMAFRLLFFHT